MVQIAGAQYKVVENDLLICEKLDNSPINEKLEFEAVKLIGTPSYTLLGRPNIEHAKVVATVEQQTKSEKLIVFKKKRRKGYKRTKGHKQDLTVLRVEKIEHEINEEMMDKAVSLGI